MNHALVLQITGRLCALLGCLLVVIGLFAAVSAGNSWGDVGAFGWSAAVAFLCFGLSRLARTGATRLSAPEGFASVTLGWLVIGALGALPFRVGGAIPSFTDAFFESVSGFTTTGASILRNVEGLSSSMLLWRSLTQWLGGMGIVALFVALLPALGAGGNFLFQAEVPGPTPGRIKPRISDTAKTLWVIYLGLTLAEIILLVIFGMSLFDAINHSFTTLSTGGFSTRNASVGAFGPAVQWTITAFMFLGGVNFAMHFVLLHGDWRSVWRNPEVRLYFTVALVAIGILVASLALAQPAPEVRQHHPSGVEGTLRHAAFQVVSIMTTTGFGTQDFHHWPALCRVVLILLMFLGACAGSTAGGIKMARILVLWKYLHCQIRRVLHPSAVLPVKLGKRSLAPAMVDSTVAFFLLYMLLYAGGVLILLMLGHDVTTSGSGVIACLSNIGPGLGAVGPAANYADVSAVGKWVLASWMLLGRLEIYSILVLFFPGMWKK